MSTTDDMPDYDSLLLQYRSGKLVPVIGSDLLKVVSSDGKKIPFERYIIGEILRDLTYLTNDATPGKAAKSLTELAISRDGLDNEVPGIYSEISSGKVDGQPYFDNSLLQLLARGDNFKYYLTTSHDRQLEELLDNDVDVYTWNHVKTEPLIINKQSPKKKLIYLFGKIAKDGEPDEEVSYIDIDKMESLFSLAASAPQVLSSDMDSLLGILKGKTLLFIGNHFEDWFMRLAIRVLCNRKFKDLRKKLVYIINDSSAAIQYEEYFIRKYGIEVVHKHPMQDFIENLMSKVLAESEFKDSHEGKQVFISYDRDNKIIAENLNSRLRQHGINTWFDVRSLEIGEYETEIRNKINSVGTYLLVSLISKELAGKPQADSYVKNIEWPIVEQRLTANRMFEAMGRQVERFKVLPVAVDEFSGYFDVLPDFIRTNNIYPHDSDQLIVDIDKFLAQ
ncbi:toll/interleukin-1 receptor domain-containing protein [Hymenobacter ruricola]|uniref:Toll/interleukin-1 receptor domain-containing protein n=1 Tax=Hymenobacter ruricola TaxID=2791023 RepID=A0ABS0I0B8_9BACT|nr:toll/interleukin-1 receptor domain-containing protein [Hymenobacter ruricola]MBF9220406.1 toll/interleukin-1 receptor domain-containing protein [Hymenobacter ruricola]